MSTCPGSSHSDSCALKLASSPAKCESGGKSCASASFSSSRCCSGPLLSIYSIRQRSCTPAKNQLRAISQSTPAFGGGTQQEMLLTAIRPCVHLEVCAGSAYPEVEVAPWIFGDHAQDHGKSLSWPNFWGSPQELPAKTSQPCTTLSLQPKYELLQPVCVPRPVVCGIQQSTTQTSQTAMQTAACYPPPVPCMSWAAQRLVP